MKLVYNINPKKCLLTQAATKLLANHITLRSISLINKATIREVIYEISLQYQS